jgi:hypothetical protein
VDRGGVRILFKGGSVMRSVFSVALALGFVFALVLGVQAEAKKDKKVTLKGKILCAKCNFAIAKKAGVKEKPDDCTTIIIVKEKGKDVVYYLDEAGHTKYHKKGGVICTKCTDGTITGKVSEEGGKKIITVADLKLKEK